MTSDPTPDRHREARERVEAAHPEPKFKDDSRGEAYLWRGILIGREQVFATLPDSGERPGPAPAGPEEPREGLREAAQSMHAVLTRMTTVDQRTEVGSFIAAVNQALDEYESATTPAPDSATCIFDWTTEGAEFGTCPVCGSDKAHIRVTGRSTPAPDTGAEERLRAAAQEVIASVHGQATGAWNSPDPKPEDFTMYVSRAAVDRLRSGLSGGSVDEERDSDES